MSRYNAGLDLGRQSDYTALVIAEHKKGVLDRKERYEVVFARRWRGSPYTALLEEIAGVLNRQPFNGNTYLRMDATGVGQAVVDVFEQARGQGVLQVKELTPIIFSAGLLPNEQTGTVPKRDLVSRVEILLDQKRLVFASDLPLAKQIREELKNYSAKMSVTGRASFEAATGHDDLVTSLALCVHDGPRPVMVLYGDWSPDDDAHNYEGLDVYDPEWEKQAKEWFGEDDS